MFLHGSAYARQLQEAFASAAELRAAIAFWGAGAERYFLSRPRGSSTRLICNLSSGACNPRVIAILQGKGCDVRTLDTLHAKVVIAEDYVLAGSANISANGLSYEGESAQGWAEAGIKLVDPQSSADAAAWFERLWLRSRPVSKNELSEIETIWRLRRSIGRPKGLEPGTGLIADLVDSEVEGANVYFALYSQPSSDEAEAILAAAQSDYPEEARTRLSLWEDWDELPHDCVLLSVHCGPRGALEIEGAYIRLPGPSIATTRGSSIQLVAQVDEVLGRRFTTHQCIALKRLCGKTLRKGWQSNPDQVGLLWALDDVLRVARQNAGRPR